MLNGKECLLYPYVNFDTNILSPTNSDGSIEDEGIKNAWKRKVLITKAINTAYISDNAFDFIHSLDDDLSTILITFNNYNCMSVRILISNSKVDRCFFLLRHKRL